MVDFGYRAIHEMTVKAKAIVEAFYGKGPRLSYFVGCSTGGRQGLMEAQRFPNDYDGIVAGAPANYWTRMPAGNLFAAAATLKDEATRLPAAKLSALHKGAIAACDARDGVTDGLIENPQRCSFDPGIAALLGRGNRRVPDGGASRRGEQDLRLGGESAHEGGDLPRHAAGQRADVGRAHRRPAAVSDRSSTSTATSSLPIPTWDWKTMDFDKDVAAGEEKAGKVLNAIDPDLRAFKARGGKLIMYHGWNDQLISPFNTINYFNSVSKTHGCERDRRVRATVHGARDAALRAAVQGPTRSTPSARSNNGWSTAASRRSSSHRTRPMASSIARARSVRIRRWPRYTGTGSIDDGGELRLQVN